MKTMVEAKIAGNTPVNNSGIYELLLIAPEIGKVAVPGQFVNIYLGDKSLILPRPLSICEIKEEKRVLRIIYQQVGKGTKCLTEYAAGDTIGLMGPLGNGFPSGDYKKIAVLGGGIGVPPLLALVQELKNREIAVFNGFRTKDMVILEDDFKNAGAKVHIATDDGSYGYHGNVLDCLKASGFSPDAIYACGPGVMLKHISIFAGDKNISAFISMEERMACGLGACVGCAVKLEREDGQAYGKVCKDGPVFDSREVVWE